MANEVTQQQIDRLARIDAANRTRVKKFIEKARSEGKRQISAMVDNETYDELCRRRDKAAQDGKPMSTADIIKQALFQDRQAKTETINLKINGNGKIESKEPEYDIFQAEIMKEYPKSADKLLKTPAPEPAPNTKTAEPTPSDKDYLLIAIDAEEGTWSEKAERLNAKGVFSKMGKPYTGNNLRLAVGKIKERLGLKLR